jgi:hypothetical protein
MFAGQYARAGDAVRCVGMLVHAVLGTAHARLVQRREWVLNEKRLVERAELQGVQALLARGHYLYRARSNGVVRRRRSRC